LLNFPESVDGSKQRAALVPNADPSAHAHALTQQQDASPAVLTFIALLLLSIEDEFERGIPSDLHRAKLLMRANLTQTRSPALQLTFAFVQTSLLFVQSIWAMTTSWSFSKVFPSSLQAKASFLQ